VLSIENLIKLLDTTPRVLFGTRMEGLEHIFGRTERGNIGFPVFLSNIVLSTENLIKPFDRIHQVLFRRRIGGLRQVPGRI
jgi:hypothetical protein